MGADLDQSALLFELEEVAEREVNRHLAMAKDWHPHDYVPWSDGKNFAALGGVDWDPEQSKLSDVAKAALVTNLLTEDNLPSYHNRIAGDLSPDGAWGTWVGRWTAEEARHSTVMRDYLVVTRGVDPVALECDRMTHMTHGFQPLARFPHGTGAAFLHTVAYVSFQELATRISHRNTGAICGDPIAEAIMQRLALDENLHMVFYRNICGAALDADPDQAMEAIANVVTNFQMPGSNMPNFRRHGVLMAKHGVYDLRQHLEEVLLPVIRTWRVFERADFTARGEAARDRLAAYLEDLRTVQVPRFEEHRDRALARDKARGIDRALAPQAV
ncbi:fatty acid desaturase type 2 [Segniliparus rotundus DSM 44985]|uniref:Fatty acid desaturase type 2 n=1 Tax=Segniliparus rotundus (strain ATCC BAA-972 / CDC 1076 / CIP 108378 / DSM 44985 / JCM 13578) TaxID=640132 RepID=D6ZAJ5_SEGRD|nr:acyl-ACP desaturase [Segniliparus rotundus]ADG96737.1 fatty acid desaturase type 2 [Segniliparus rotundus DSM 44985]